MMFVQFLKHTISDFECTINKNKNEVYYNLWPHNGQINFYEGVW